MIKREKGTDSGNRLGSGNLNFIKSHGAFEMVRIIDENVEEYPYSVDRFAPINVPAVVKKTLA